MVDASCRDYEAGATVDVDVQSKAIGKGEGITVPLLLLYSQGYLQKRAKHPMQEVWGPPYSVEDVQITAHPIGDGIGHFLPEEAPDLTADALLKWLPTLRD